MLEWRRINDHEWWLVHRDAPHSPPSMTITWSGPESCCHLTKLYNAAWPGDEEDEDYLHICDPRDFIAELQSWIEAAEYPA